MAPHGDTVFINIVMALNRNGKHVCATLLYDMPIHLLCFHMDSLLNFLHKNHLRLPRLHGLYLYHQSQSPNYVFYLPQKTNNNCPETLET